MNKYKTIILHVINDLDVGGTEMMLLRTLPRLNEFKHVVCSLSSQGVIGESLIKEGIGVIALNQKRLLSIGSLISLVKVIKKVDPDIIQTYLFQASFIGRFAALYTKKHIVISSIRSSFAQARYIIVVLLDIITSIFVKHYLSNSLTAAKRFHKWGIPLKKISVIYNGIEVNRVGLDVDFKKIKEKIGIPSQAIILSCLAKLRKGKGHIILFKALKEINKNNNLDNINLLLIGDGPEKNRLFQKVNEYHLSQKVFFLGNRKDISELLRMTDIFVLPTLFEGMSNAILEAMADGLPIITTDIPENNELIKNNEHGILVKPKDFNKLAEVIYFLISNRDYARELGSKARERVNKEFTIDTTIQKLKKFYQNVYQN